MQITTNSNGVRIGLALVVSVLTLHMGSLLAAPVLVIGLSAGAAVDGSHYVVGDVATWERGSAELWARVEQEPLGICPAPGETTYLSAVGLLGVLKQRGYDWRRIEITGATVTAVRAAEQSVPPETTQQVLLNRMQEKLGVEVALVESQPLPAVQLPAGRLEIHVRFPDKPGWWLPDAVEFNVDGRLAAVVPLRRYVSFELPVVVAPDGIAGRTQISRSLVVLEQRELLPGQEVATCIDDITGKTTRTRIQSGALVVLSRLKLPYDVARGEEVTLVFASQGIMLRAQAVALNNAYIGQQLLAQRLSDDKKYSGVLREGRMVVVK